MLWNRKVLFFSSAIAGGCYSLKCLNYVLRNKSTIQAQEQLNDNESTFIFIPESSEYFFDEEDVSSNLSAQHQNIPKFWQLLMLSKSKKRSDRHSAVKMLSDLNSLEKWEYMMISQACEPSTAIGLARSSKIHKSFFLPSPFRISKMRDSCQSLLDIITLLPFNDVDSSVQTLWERAKKIGCRIINEKELDDEPEDFLDIYHSERKKKDILVFHELCVRIFFNHSLIQSHKLILMKNGILKQLWDILEYNKQNTSLKSLLAQTLANLAFEKELKNDLYYTGWVRILAVWSRSPNINISLPSAKALANLDDDDYDYSSYDTDVYLLHPVIRLNDRKLNADVIFIHGINGATFWTWRQSDNMKKFATNYKTDDFEVSDLSKLIQHNLYSYTYCWPKDWLAVDFPEFRFLSVDYRPDTNKKKPFKKEADMNDGFYFKAKLLVSKLLKANVGEKPIIWVTHSMGGLLLKQLLIEASRNHDDKANLITKNTVGIVFFSVPHKGSELATFLQSVPYIFQPSVKVSQLHKDSPLLLSLHNDFMKIVHKYKIAVLSFAETKKSKWLFNWEVVSKESADPGIGEFYLLPVDHLSTCKPENRDSFVYLKLKEFLQSHVPVRSLVTEAFLESELNNYICLIP